MSPTLDPTAAYLGARGAAPGSVRLAGCPLLASGKVRDVYELDAGHLLFVTSDRVSAFDVVMDAGVPHKGRALTAIATHWFERTRDLIDNHLVSTSLDELSELPDELRPVLDGRVMIVQRAEPTPVEWVVRAYLAGSGFKDYAETGSLFGNPLPPGLELASRLPEPLLTPTTKNDAKDLPISKARARELVGDDVYKAASEASFTLFERGAQELAPHELLLADTKFEFGVCGSRVLLIDEALTPDSSRMWPEASWKPGSSPPSYDKQLLRDHLETLDWDKGYPAPHIDPAILERLGASYLELCERLTGRPVPGVRA